MKGRNVPSKAIETVYNNYRFRSRLEARWAVFFDTLGVAYEYEREGYSLGVDGRYLPDFYFPHLNSWMEVKGITDKSAASKAKKLADATGMKVFLFTGNIDAPGDFQDGSRGEVYLPGSINLKDTQSDHVESIRLASFSVPFIEKLYFVNRRAMLTAYELRNRGVASKHLVKHLLAALSEDEAAELQPFVEPSYVLDWGVEFDEGGYDNDYLWCECAVCGFVGVEYEGRSERLDCRCQPNGHKERTGDSKRLTAAYAAARQARFEFGESGARQ